MGIKKLREERGLSRREPAERSGVNLRSIQDYEQGHKKGIEKNQKKDYKNIIIVCRI